MGNKPMKTMEKTKKTKEKRSRISWNKPIQIEDMRGIYHEAI